MLAFGAGRSSPLTRSIVGLIVAVMISAQTTEAQTGIQVELTGGSVSFGTPTPADFNAHLMEATEPMPVQVTTSSEPSGAFTTTIKIRSSSPTLGGGKPLSDLEWRTADDVTWHALTSSDIVVDSRTADGTPSGHTWSNTIYFRVALHWTSDSPAEYTGNLVITVTTTEQ